MMINDFERINFDAEDPTETVNCLVSVSASFRSIGGNCINDALMGNTTISVRPIYRKVILKLLLLNCKKKGANNLDITNAPNPKPITTIPVAKP